MKKLTAILFMVFFSLSASALTGFLESQWTEGQWKYCKYSNGKIITISNVSLCPLSID